MEKEREAVEREGEKLGRRFQSQGIYSAVKTNVGQTRRSVNPFGGSHFVGIVGGNLLKGAELCPLVYSNKNHKIQFSALLACKPGLDFHLNPRLIAIKRTFGYRHGLLFNKKTKTSTLTLK